MSWQHQSTDEDGIARSVHIRDLPDECPCCNRKGTFTPLSLYTNSKANDPNKLEIIFRCSNSKCREIFIGYYTEVNGNVFDLKKTAPKTHTEVTFSEMVTNTSSDFSKIYDQASKAESEGLDQICGAGYRKALEFLIKDYLLSKTEDGMEKEIIKNEFLGSCIDKRIQDANIKLVAKRATWLGNDETHYVRKWEEKDLQDLKKLINLTIHWIEADILTQQLLEDMPEKKNPPENNVVTENSSEKIEATKM